MRKSKVSASDLLQTDAEVHVNSNGSLITIRVRRTRQIVSVTYGPVSITQRELTQAALSPLTAAHFVFCWSKLNRGKSLHSVALY